MTDAPPPLSDEELSAHLDGETTPEVAARVAADPDARVRLELLASASHAIAASVTPLAPHTVDHLVAQALAAASKADETEGSDNDLADGARRASPTAGAAGSDTSEVTLLAPRRSGRSRPPTWLVAAALILLVALGTGLVISGRNHDARRQVTAAGSSSKGAGSGGPDRAASEKTGQPSGPAESDQGSEKSSPSVSVGHGAPVPGSNSTGSTTTTPDTYSVGVIALGSFPSPDALRTSLAASFPTASAASTDVSPTAASLRRCGDQIRIALSLTGPPLHEGYGSVAGAPVLVYEFAFKSLRDHRATTLVAAVGTASCDPVVTFQR